MAQRPFRFGVHIGPADAPGELVTMARRAEQIGYEMFVVDDSARHGWGVWSVLAATAVATRRAELVAMTAGGRGDRCARDAKELATLQLLSGGRARLGCGGPAGFSDLDGTAPACQVALLAPPPAWPLAPVVASLEALTEPPVVLGAWVSVAAVVGGAPGFLTKVATRHGADRVAVGECVQILVGSVPEIVETIEDRRDRWGISLVVVPAAKAEEFGPVVERLAGR